MTPQPFELRIPDAAIADLKTRLGLTRFPDAAPGEPWAFGTSVDYVRDLVSYWKDSFDWRAQEAALNHSRSSRCHCTTSTCITCTFPASAQPYPLLLLHGWPGSVFEFLDIIPRLTDPARFGGDPKDAFTVIAPSLPGYGLSFKPGQKRFTLQDIAACLHDLMTKILGFRNSPRKAATGAPASPRSLDNNIHRPSAASTLIYFSRHATRSAASFGRAKRDTVSDLRTGSKKKPAINKFRAPNRRRWLSGSRTRPQVSRLGS